MAVRESLRIGHEAAAGRLRLDAARHRSTLRRYRRAGSPRRAMRRGTTMTITERANAWAPQILSILRIIVALLFFEHGTVKLFGWPGPGPAQLSTLLYAAAIIEVVGGALLAVGLFGRLAAFIMSGEMAFAYFISHHMSPSFFPILNRGDAAILYCFVFLYIAAAGGGPWSLDRALRNTD
jgi:putative oxidoreductase